MANNCTILKVFQPVFQDKSDIVLLYGGRGSGKSHFAAQKVILRIVTEPGHRFLVVHKFENKIKKTVFNELLSVIGEMGLTSLFKVNSSTHEITYIDPKSPCNGNTILFIGIDKSEKAKSISGITSAWFEEMTFFSKDDFDAIATSIFRGVYPNYQQIICTFNPTHKKHWIYKEFFVKKTYQQYNSVNTYHSTYKDNPFAGKQGNFIESLRGNVNKYLTDAKGEWYEQSSATIYTNWEIDASVSTDWKEYKQTRGGIDFGMTDPTTVILAAYEDGVIYVFKELYKSDITTMDLIRYMKKDFPLEVYYGCDNQRNDSVRELQRAGIRAFGAKKGGGSVNSGIDWIRSKKIKIHPSCVHFIEEIEDYQWRTNPQDENDIYEEPVGGNDHLLDALRYAFKDIMEDRRIKATTRWF